MAVCDVGSLNISSLIQHRIRLVISFVFSGSNDTIHLTGCLFDAVGAFFTASNILSKTSCVSGSLLKHLMLLLVLMMFNASSASGKARLSAATIRSYFKKERQLALIGQKRAQWPHPMQRPADLMSISGSPVPPNLTIPAGQTFIHVPHFVHFEGSTVIDGTDITPLL